MQNIIHEKLDGLKSSVANLVHLFNKTKNVDTDFKEILMSNKIDITNSWVSNDTYIDRPSSAMRKIYNPESELFQLYNGEARLTCFDSGEVKYEDLKSKTSLVFKENIFVEATIQEENSKPVSLNADQTIKFLDALGVSENLDIMLSDVNNSTNRLIAKSTENTENAEKLASLDLSLSSSTVEEILQRVNKMRKPPIDALSNKNTLK